MARRKPPQVQNADGRFYDQCRIADAAVPKLARHLTSHGYGVPADRIETILRKLTPEDRAELLYVCYRVSDKLGTDALGIDAFEEE